MCGAIKDILTALFCVILSAVYDNMYVHARQCILSSYRMGKNRAMIYEYLNIHFIVFLGAARWFSRVIFCRQQICGSGSAWIDNILGYWIRIRIGVKRRIRIRINLMQIRNLGWHWQVCFHNYFLCPSSLSVTISP